MAPVCYFCGSNLHKSSDCPQYVAEVAFNGDKITLLYNNKIQQERGTSVNPSPLFHLFHHHNCNTMTTIDLLLPRQPDLLLPRQPDLLLPQQQEQWRVDDINNSIYLASII